MTFMYSFNISSFKFAMDAKPACNLNIKFAYGSKVSGVTLRSCGRNRECNHIGTFPVPNNEFNRIIISISENDFLAVYN